MNAVIDFPPIADAMPPAAALAVPTIKDAALATFTRTEAALRITAEKWRGVAFAVETPKGLGEAKAARHELREQGRLAVQRVRDATKDELNDLKRVVVAEAERLIAIVQPVEDAIDAQIKTREAVLAAEKAERERIEAERIAKHRAGIETIRSYVGQAQGKSAAQIEAGLQTLLAMRFDDSANFEEFTQEASQEMHSTLEALRHMRDTAQAREAEAARIEAQRVENARVAAEQAAERQRLADQAADLARQQQEIEAARQRAMPPPAPPAPQGTADTPAPGERETAPRTTEGLDSQHVLKAEAARPDATDRENPVDASPVGGPMGAGQPAAAGPVVGATINLGTIVDRLGFIVSAEFLATLGVEAKTERGSKLYPADAFPAICAAIAQHVLAVGEEYSK